jgi:D-threonine aldolase
LRTSGDVARTGSIVGQPVERLTTPVLLLDLPAVRRNVAAMAEWARDLVEIRPHAKIHKCVEIALMQQQAGAIGATAATVWEAEPLVRAGVREVLIANEVVGEEKLELLARLAVGGRVIAAVDDVRLVDLYSAAASRAGAELGVLVEIDVGMGRGGARTEGEARAVAEAAAAAPGLVLRGAMGYEGHAVLEPDRTRRQALVEEAMAKLLHLVELLRADGHELPIVSAGGTNTYDLTGAIDGVTELQAGTYALMDTAYASFAPRFEPALSVAGRVAARHGERVVLDCGSKTVGVPELEQPRPRTRGLELRALHEEHSLLDVVDGVGPDLADVVELVVGYCGGAVNSHDAYVVIEDGVVVDVWPIVGRGPGRVHTR